MATEKQIAANRANSHHSSGPVTSEGKQTSSHNAVKSGLTGQTVLLKTDDVAVYNLHIDRFMRFANFTPNITAKNKPPHSTVSTQATPTLFFSWRGQSTLPRRKSSWRLRLVPA